jgi:excinuclease ABC subunit C
MLLNKNIKTKEVLKNIPSKPGIYRMLDSKERVLYVGKAKNLKKRLPSYFQSVISNQKTNLLMSKVTNLDFTVTNTENEALIMEYTLIKKHKPKFNVVLRDDKSYPYIFISTEQEFPRVEFRRKNKSTKGRYFGPYPNVSAVRETLSELQKVFNVRQCKDSYFNNRSRPCLQYQIKRCSAPCVNLISKKDYSLDVNSTISFLRGRNTSIINTLIKQMDKLSSKKKYEEASRYRDQIKRLKEIQSKQLAISNQKYDLDVIGLASDGVIHCVTVLFVRNGSISGSKNYFPKIHNCNDVNVIQNGFILQHYFDVKPPGEIILPEAAGNKDLIERSFQLKFGRKTKLNHNVRGNRLRWLQLAEKNAKSGLLYEISSKSSIKNKLKTLGDLILHGKAPKRLECFDVSHTSGEATVASCVVFNESGPLKSDYRRFNISTDVAGDDYAALSEALLRRYKRIKNQEITKPDILFIDGGKGQLSACINILKSLGIYDLNVVAIAKGSKRQAGNETLFINKQRPIKLPSNSPALHMIQNIRDEAHRFAIIGHRNKRNANQRKSRLDGIEGIGPKRKHQLLKQFGGIRGVLEAGIEDLESVIGISKDMSKRIYDNLHKGT